MLERGLPVRPEPLTDPRLGTHDAGERRVVGGTRRSRGRPTAHRRGAVDGAGASAGERPGMTRTKVPE